MSENNTVTVVKSDLYSSDWVILKLLNTNDIMFLKNALETLVTNFNIQNILPAVLAAFIRNFSLEDIRLALETFIPSPAQTPGRMNMFTFRDFTVMVDYAHNTAGFEAIAKFLEKTEATVKVGVIAGVGDRRDEDIISLGSVSAKMFDEIVIRQDKNLRGRTEEEIVSLMEKGIRAVDKKKKITNFSKEAEAIDYVINNAAKGSFIVICSDVVPAALEQIMKYKEREEKELMK